MRKAACVLVLIASICFQGVSLAKQVLAGDRGGDSAHTSLHLDGVAHHHDADGSIHKDTSPKSNSTSRTMAARASRRCRLPTAAPCWP
jgi:hypothetical protein